MARFNIGVFLCSASFLFSDGIVSDGLDDMKLHALYLMQQNNIEESIEKYRDYADLSRKQDFETLGRLGIILLQKGIQSTDTQTILMTLFGAGLCGSSGALEILEKGISHPDPQIQLLSMHFITKYEDDRTNDLLTKAMNSDYLGVRMEAAYYMALRKHPHAVGQIEGLMYRLPPSFKPYFPPLFALLGTSDATRTLKRLIEDPDPQTRVESILNVARLGRDDFVPMLRKRLTHSHVAEVEAAAFAMGVLKDSYSIPRLKKLALSPTDAISLAASVALFQLGDRSFVDTIIGHAKRSNLFAISALGAISHTEDALAKLVGSSDLQVRTNAAISLLQRKDARCMKPLLEILLTDERDLAFQPFSSVGRTLTSMKAIPSAELRAKDPTVDLSYSIALREQLLKEAMHLPDNGFLRVAKAILMRSQSDLVPLTITLLENLQTEEAIALLKEGAEQMKSPLVRDYCHLALYRLKVEGPYEEYMTQWVMNQKEADLIQLRQMLPWKYRLQQSDYTLTPQETSRLLIDAFLTIANRRDEKSIAFLLEMIQKGNIQNRYALMGILMKATE